MKILFFLISILIIIYFFVPHNAKLMHLEIWPTKPRQIIQSNSDPNKTEHGGSKEVFDIYSFSHITHGIIFYFVLKYFGLKETNIIYVSIILELLWEILENSPFIIKRFQRNKEYANWTGDSIVNIIGDVISMLIGLYIAKFSKVFAILYLIISEVILTKFHASLFQNIIGFVIPNSSNAGANARKLLI